ncbi:hypothetical protein GCM10023082_08370 [Streptomyces tremellae]|uniref:Uncharacterized protein n=1 Tax=Streptomyces tremellae TaxID=1124239 RepID=A0ABP7E499_9ACTN
MRTQTSYSASRSPGRYGRTKAPPVPGAPEAPEGEAEAAAEWGMATILRF